MRKTAQRKFFLFGRYSLALLLPKKWLREFNIQKGAIHELELDRKKGRVIIYLKAPEKSDESILQPSSNDFSPIPPL